MPWYPLDNFDPQFFEDAPVVASVTMELPTDADTVWSELTGDRPLHWCRMLRGGRYVTPAPHGIGTIRQMGSPGGLLKVQERFISWDDAQRSHAFSVAYASLPGIRRFGERTVVRPTESGCTLTWTIAAEARYGARILHPIVRRVAQSLFSDTEKYFSCNESGVRRRSQAG
jgi:hypothetical protein